ncbi:TPA: IncL/M-type plasmid replication leader peptide RepB [Enterobacter hormaechei subsp. steigerwaltii]
MRTLLLYSPANKCRGW